MGQSKPWRIDLMEDLYPVSFNKIMQAANYTVFVLGTPKKQFSIFTAPEIGETIEKLLSQTPSARPKTHDLLDSLFKGLSISPFQLIIHDVKESIYYCKLFLEQSTTEDQKILEIDVRPSDGLIIALSYNIPIFCTQPILEKSPEFQEEV